MLPNEKTNETATTDVAKMDNLQSTTEVAPLVEGNQPTFSESGRIVATDKLFGSNVSNAVYVNHVFLRLVAKGRKFSNVDFRYSIFDTSYLRNCSFDSCDFTGCRFERTNMYGTSFTGCKFDYANFERSIVDDDVLDSGCPGHENLKMRFARSLRMNYQQIGDAKAANKAIGVELEATAVYLHKSWHSNESYYRKKYAQWNRAKAFFEWGKFKALDLIWGNGESTWKLGRAIAFMLLFMTIVDVLCFKDRLDIRSYSSALLEAPQVFLGILSPSGYSTFYLTLIVFCRLVTFGFLMSIIIKRFNRR